MAVCRGSNAVWAVLLCIGLPHISAQFFEVLQYRNPSQCERMQCLSVQMEWCREHLEGFYLKEKGCPAGQICTNCEFGNSSVPTRCKCENPPFQIPAVYGQECNAGRVCQANEGSCFRPCITFLHSTQCPADRCRWNTTSYACDMKHEAPPPLVWNDELEIGQGPFQEGEAIVEGTAPGHFPISFMEFKASSRGYSLRGVRLEDIIRPETLFLQLDRNNDGGLDALEFSRLPSTILSMDALAAQRRESEPVDGSMDFENASETMPLARRLQNVTIVSPEACGAQYPPRYYCSFDMSCKDDCKQCGWKSSTDTTFSICVRPTPASCHAEGQKVYCPADQTCHASGDCRLCVDSPVVDHSQHICLSVWWDPEPSPLWTNWVCRDRNKVGMSCRHDQDCIYGLRRCLEGVCQPLQPYNANHTCESHFDCWHLNYYCPRDPTGGDNPYWIQYCRQQKGEGLTCDSNEECGPGMLCNSAEAQPRCRRLFSLEIGIEAQLDELCSLGWRDRNDKCAMPAKSKEAGRSCDSDRDCTTTDQTGRNGACRCKEWWQRGDSKYCQPVPGDYPRYQEKLRNYKWFVSMNCGVFWNEAECLQVYGNTVLKLKLEVECEIQMLALGPYQPPDDCGIVDEERFPDHCARLSLM